MKTLVHVLFVITLVCITGQLAFTYSGSAPPSGKTNAPGESACTDCHGDFALATSGTLWNNITLTANGSPVSSLTPNTTYTMSLSFSNPSSSKFGFELVALESGANGSSPSIGTLTATSPETEVNSAGNRVYLSHSGIGTAAPSHSKSWTFEYTTPNTPNVGVDFFVVVNSTNGDGSTSGDQIISKVFSANVMPVKWLSCGVRAISKANLIEWSTACETNNNYFSIERSMNALDWKTIGKVLSKGNSNTVLKYAFKDEDISFAKGFYRIKQVDFDGRYDYSKVLSLSTDNTSESISYDAETRIIRISNSHQIAPATLYTLNGNPVAHSDEGTVMDVSTIEKGIYFLQLPSGLFQKIFIY